MIYKIKQKHTYNHIYNDKKRNQKNMKECDKRKSHINSKLHAIYLSSNDATLPSEPRTSKQFISRGRRVSTKIFVCISHPCMHVACPASSNSPAFYKGIN